MRPCHSFLRREDILWIGHLVVVLFRHIYKCSRLHENRHFPVGAWLNYTNVLFRVRRRKFQIITLSPELAKGVNNRKRLACTRSVFRSSKLFFLLWKTLQGSKNKTCRLFRLSRFKLFFHFRWCSSPASIDVHVYDLLVLCYLGKG